MGFASLPFSNATHCQNALDQYMYRILILIFFVISFPLLPLTHLHQNRDLHSSSPLLRTLSSGLTVERETRDGVVDCHRRRLRRSLPNTPRRPAASTSRPRRRFRPRSPPGRPPRPPHPRRSQPATERRPDAVLDTSLLWVSHLPVRRSSQQLPFPSIQLVLVGSP